jgi:hypothetical protein
MITCLDVNENKMNSSSIRQNYLEEESFRLIRFWRGKLKVRRSFLLRMSSGGGVGNR